MLKKDTNQHIMCWRKHTKMMFKCPVCGERHRVSDNYDNQDYVCENSAGRLHRRTFQDLQPDDLLLRGGYNWNKHSLFIDEARAAVVEVGGPGFNSSGERIGTSKKNW